MWRVGRVWVASCPRDARPASLSCSLCLPGRVGSVGRVRSRARGASSPPPVASFSGSLHQTFAQRDANWATWGRVSGSWREKGKVGPPHLSRPQAAPQSWCGRCSAPLCLMPPSIPGLQPLKRLSSCARDFPQFQLRTCRVHRSHLAWGVGWGCRVPSCPALPLRKPG